MLKHNCHSFISLFATTNIMQVTLIAYNGDHDNIADNNISVNDNDNNNEAQQEQF